MTTILITGVAGFIGHRTSEMLLAEGYRIVGLDNMNNYYDNSLQEYRLNALKKHEHFSFYYADIRDAGKINEIFAHHPFSAVVHLAAKTGVRDSIKNPHVYMATNTQGTLNILEAMVKNNVKKLVFASTSSVYSGQELPFIESLPTDSPISPYAATKKAAEIICNTYHLLYGLDVSIVRYFTVYGPGGRPDMSYFKFIKSIEEGKPITIYGDGSQKRDFSYIDDIANGTVNALKSVGYEIFNLGSNNGTYSLLDLIALIEKNVGKKAKIIYEPFDKSDMKATWANIDKAINVLGWQPTVSLEEGIERCVKWYLNNKSWVANINIV
ncbi:MAG: SDR family NAD(P)-dependent oxidoreductase [Cytophagales bacterium]|nr:MAG: SDR family NAD(P)-dependent oxidoreductase [Cytophagales bacterium]